MWILEGTAVVVFIESPAKKTGSGQNLTNGQKQGHDLPQLVSSSEDIMLFTCSGAEMSTGPGRLHLS
jgi:hypothetical protein